MEPLSCKQLEEFANEVAQECYLHPDKDDEHVDNFCSLDTRDRVIVMWEALGDFEEAFVRGNQVACNCTERNYGEWNNVQNKVLCELTKPLPAPEENEAIVEGEAH